MPASKSKQAGRRDAAAPPPAKKAGKPKTAAKPKVPTFEIWRCHVEWVEYHGKRYEKGDTLNVFRFMLTDEAEMKVIRKYFTKTKTESVAMVSGPVELLAEGD